MTIEIAAKRGHFAEFDGGLIEYGEPPEKINEDGRLVFLPHLVPGWRFNMPIRISD